MLMKKLARMVAGREEEKDLGEESVMPKEMDEEERQPANKKGLLHELMMELAEKLDVGNGEEEEDEENGEVEMPKKDFKEEHEKLVSKLHRQDPKELEDEAKEQEKELEDVESEDEDDEEGKKKKGGLAIVMALKKMSGKGE